MRTLDVLDKAFVDVNSMIAFREEPPKPELVNQQLAIVQKLQSTLDIDQLLAIFAEYAQEHVDLVGLFFNNGRVRATVNEQGKGKAERRFELKIGQECLLRALLQNSRRNREHHLHSLSLRKLHHSKNKWR